MKLQETMGGQSLDLSPVTLQVLQLAIPLVVFSCLMLHVYYTVQVLRFPERIRQGRLHMLWRPVHWSMAAWLLCFFLLANLVLSWLLGLYAHGQGLNENATERLFISVAGLCSYGVVLMTLAWLFSRDALRWRDIFGCRHVPLRQSLKGGAGFLLASFPVCWLASMLSIYVLFSLGIPLEKQNVFDFFNQPQPTWFYLCLGFIAVVGAPVIEELVFRGLLLPLLCKYIPVRFAILLVSLVFASIHLNVMAFFPLFILALYLSFAALYFRTVMAPIAMHMLFNAVNLGVFLLLGS